MSTSSQPAAASATPIYVDVHGASWCEDTSRTRRLLRRLGIAHRYHDVDEDLAALERATRLNNGVRRTPVVTFGDSVEAPAAVFVEPANEALAAAIVEYDILAREDVADRLQIQNVGDVERCLRAGVGLSLLAAAARAPRRWRGVAQLVGGALLLSGTAGWCPAYQALGVTSLDGPGDRPLEAERTDWLRPAASPASAAASAAGADAADATATPSSGSSAPSGAASGATSGAPASASASVQAAPASVANAMPATAD